MEIKGENYIPFEEFVKHAKDGELFVGSTRKLTKVAYIKDLDSLIQELNGKIYYHDNKYQRNFADSIVIDVAECTKSEILTITTHLNTYHPDEYHVVDLLKIRYWWD